MRTTRWRLGGGVLVALLTWIAMTFATTGAGVAADGPRVSACGTALVAIAAVDQVLPVDVASGTVGDPITVLGAYNVAVSPDARTAWVVGNHESDPVWTISRIDLTTGNVGDPAAIDYIPDIGPVSNIVVSPDGSLVYVGTLDRLGVIDASTLDVITVIPYNGTAIYGTIALTPDGQTAFVGTGSGSSVVTIDLRTNTTGPLVNTGAWPGDLSMTPDGSTVYTANQLSESITPIDVATLTAKPDVPLPFSPVFVDAAPDGGTAVASGNTSLARVDMASGAISPAVPLGSSGGTVLMPDGRTTFVLDTIPPSVYSVDVDTGAKGPAVALPDFPHGIAAIAPSQAPTAAFSNAPALSGLPTTFDASPSAASCGAIATYRWDFGDGAVVTTSTPTIDHEYETAGTYDVTLTVADAAGTSTTKVFTGQATLRNGGPEAQVSQEVVVGQGPVVATPSFTG